jgi:hypothetical protein
MSVERAVPAGHSARSPAYQTKTSNGRFDKSYYPKRVDEEVLSVTHERLGSLVGIEGGPLASVPGPCLQLQNLALIDLAVQT